MSVCRGQLVLLELETSPETRGPGAHRLPHHLASIKVLEVGVLGVFYGLVGWDMARHSGCPQAPQLPPLLQVRSSLPFSPLKYLRALVGGKWALCRHLLHVSVHGENFTRQDSRRDSHRWREVGPWWVNEWVLCWYASSCASSIRSETSNSPTDTERNNNEIEVIKKISFLVSIQNSVRICVYYVATIYSKGQEIKKKILWNSCMLPKFLSDILPFYNPISRALLIGLFRSDQVWIPLEIISSTSTEAEPTLTPSEAQVTMPSCKYQLTENQSERA